MRAPGAPVLLSAGLLGCAALLVGCASDPRAAADANSADAAEAATDAPAADALDVALSCDACSADQGPAPCGPGTTQVCGGNPLQCGCFVLCQSDRDCPGGCCATLQDTVQRACTSGPLRCPVDAGTDADDASDGASGDACVRPAVSGLSGPTPCGGATDAGSCPAGYQCLPHSGAVLQQLCGRPCASSCECPEGEVCGSYTDKAGTHPLCVAG